MPEVKKQKRGFALMSKAAQKMAAAKGGRTAADKGTAHRYTSEEAKAAGQKGGKIISADREHMRRIGRVGGKKSHDRAAKTTMNPQPPQV